MKKIIIDAGHGGIDTGASYEGINESDINLSISNLLYLMLKNNGFCVDRSRIINKKLDLSERVFIANQLNSDLFISIHCDAFHDFDVSGMSTHISKNASAASKQFAENILKSMSKSFPDNKNRGIKESNFYILKNTIMPAVLIECEFLSNNISREFLKQPENQFVIAAAIATGISSIWFD